MDAFLADRLQCPACGAPLDDGLDCRGCGATYGETDGIYDLVVEPPEGLDALGERAAELAESDGVEEVEAEYESFVSDDEAAARQAAGEAFGPRLRDADGFTLELAAGMGGVFQLLLGLEGVTPVATDISTGALEQLRARLDDPPTTPHAYVACDARMLPFRDGSVDTVVTAGGLNNIAGADRALAEAGRVLDGDGSLLGMNLFVEPGTASAERAADLGVDAAYLRESFERAAEEAGFGAVAVDVVSEVEATENPYDVMPVAGDTLRYALLECRF